MKFKVKPIRGLEDIEEFEKTSWDHVLEAESTYDLFCDAAREKPDDAAITFLPTGDIDEAPVQITFRQLAGRITQAANMFADLGAGPTDAIAILLPSIPQTHFAMWGAQTAGIVCPINFLLTPDQIAELLNAAGATILVSMGSHPVLDIRQKVEKIRSEVPTLKAILVVGEATDETKGIYNFDEKIATYPADRLEAERKFSRENICTYFHTGGTTGSPKLARLTQGNMIHAVWAIAQMYGYTSDSIAVNPLPLFHVAGSVILGLSPLCSGTQIIIPTAAGFRNPVALKNHWKMVEKYRPTHVGGVPANMVAIQGVPPAGEDLSSIRYFYTGGAALPVETEKYFRDSFDIPVFKMYGMTESTGMGAMNPVGTGVKIGCLGMRVPYEALKIAGLGPDGSPGKTCEANETGAVLLRGPNIFPGYKDQSQNKGAFTEDGWFITGDMGYLDDEGELYITGRSKDLINRSGHSIDPALIEEAVIQHPAVDQCAAVGKPDPYAGELPVVYVTLRPDHGATPDEILTVAGNNISERPAMPREIIIIDRMPVTAIGKIFKPELRADQVRRTFTDALTPLTEKGVTATVSILGDKRRGNVASIELSASRDIDRTSIEKEAEKIIGGYTVPYDISWK